MPYEKTTWKSRDLITASKMNNIENGIETAGEDKFVRYDVAQNLTETQKTQARENIGAAGEGGGSSSEWLVVNCVVTNIDNGYRIDLTKTWAQINGALTAGVPVCMVFNHETRYDNGVVEVTQEYKNDIRTSSADEEGIYYVTDTVYDYSCDSENKYPYCIIIG